MSDLTFFGATVRPDGRPHSAGVGATWVDGAFTARYSAPSAGSAPWYLYRLTLHHAIGVAGAEPHGATRWDFKNWKSPYRKRTRKSSTRFRTSAAASGS
ncbi:MAG TPA: hypothetical protein VFC19_41760 [Candidatus Limnocylindrales bacterium]|nr:hypothetical protein [Candidatus Limnocylindrales bacterium]